MKRSGAKGEETNAGTAKFMAPELHIGVDKEATKALDIWALGIILYMMVFGYHPYATRDRQQTVKNIIEQKVRFSHDINVTNELKDLICNMLEKNPDKRINMFKILSHKWFDLPSYKFDKVDLYKSKDLYATY